LGDDTVSAEGVTRALGLADDEAFTRLVTAIADQDAPAALGLIAQLASRGADLRRFVADALGFFRGIFLAQYAPNLEEITDEPPEILNEWRRMAKVVPSSDVLRAIDLFSEALLHLRQGREERLMLELAVIRLTRPETTVDAEALAERMDRLETEVKMGMVPSRQSPVAGTETTPVAGVEESPDASPQSPVESQEKAATDAGTESPVEDQEPADKPDTAVPTTNYQLPATPDEVGSAGGAAVTLAEFSAAWPVIVSRIRSDFGARRHAFVKVAEPRSVEGSVAVLTMPSHQHFHLEQLNADEQLRTALESIAAEILGSALTLQFRSGDDPAPQENEVVDEPPLRAPEKDDLEEGKDREDPADMVVDLLGGTIIEE
ncbi:MAG: hypothetical protein U9R47_06250, partial [Actinomycetota bacterium]|nr:hypothetical protein [Actinomycetota bacterium]